MIKLNETQNGNCHTIALLDSFNTPEEPHTPITPSCSLAEIYFDLLANKNDSAMFFNFLFSIETVNPFAVLIHDYESYHNTIGDGFGSVLESFGYNIHNTQDGDILAIDKSIKPELLGLSTKSIADLFKLNSFTRIEASYGIPYGNQQDRVKELYKGVFEDTISTCSLFHGGGTFEYGNRPAFLKHGFTQKLNLVSEINDDYLSHSFDVNRESFSQNTKILSGNMLNHDQFKHINSSMLLTAGIVCKGASKAALSKLKLGSAEKHPSEGPLFYPTMKHIISSNSAIVVLENTDTYSSSNSYMGLKAFMKSLNYDISDGIINRHDCGSIESRNRLFCIAIDTTLRVSAKELFISKGSFVGPRKTINHIIDKSIDDNDPRYKDYRGLKEKEIRDSNNNKGFKRTVLIGNEIKTPTLRAQYSKAGSCDTFYSSPSNPERSRKLTGLEICRIKGFDDTYITDSYTKGETLITTLLGQGVTFDTTFFVFDFIASLIKELKHSLNNMDLKMCISD